MYLLDWFILLLVIIIFFNKFVKKYKFTIKMGYIFSKFKHWEKEKSNRNKGWVAGVKVEVDEGGVNESEQMDKN